MVDEGEGGWLTDRYVSYTWDMDELLARKEEIVRRDLLKTSMGGLRGLEIEVMFSQWNWVT